MNLNEKYGKYALITGASSGIGEAFARKLAELGMNLVLIARREDRLERIKFELLEKYNIDIINIKLDLLQEDFLDVIISQTKSLEIGMLINNAGYGSTGLFNNNDSLFEINMVKLNCVVPTILTHHFIKQMVERKKGAVIFLGSVVAVQPTPIMSTYSATKVFNAYLGESLWYEMRRNHIDVLSLNPGGTSTEFQRIADISSGPFTRTAEQVVNTGLNALGRKPSVIDGFPNKLTSVIARFLPKKLGLFITGKVIEKIYNSQK